jgi:hypothetical protein
MSSTPWSRNPQSKARAVARQPLRIFAAALLSITVAVRSPAVGIGNGAANPPVYGDGIAESGEGYDSGTQVLTLGTLHNGEIPVAVEAAALQVGPVDVIEPCAPCLGGAAPAASAVCECIPPTPTVTPEPAVSVDVTSVSGKPGDQIDIDVIMRAPGFAVTAFQNDLSFAPLAVKPMGCTVNPQLDKELSAFAFSIAGLRAIIVGLNDDPIPDGAVLYTCIFEILSNAPPGTYPLYSSHLVASSPAGERLPVQDTDSIITVIDDRPTRTPTPTATPPPPAIVVQDYFASAGEQLTIDVGLATWNGPALVAGTQNDVVFDPINAPIRANADGRPDCAVNPNINKTGTAFAFQPSGCHGTDCAAVRAIVLSFSNSDPIPSGPLYTCQVAIAPQAAAAAYPLDITNVILSDPSGDALPDAYGVGGAIYVVGPTPTPGPDGPAVVLSSVAGQAGDQLEVAAILKTGGFSIAGVQNDIGFDPLNAPIAADAHGRPACAVNPDIDKAATSFAFLPPGCQATACTGVRAIVFAVSNTDTIPDGATLYTCLVDVAPTAPAGRYVLTVSGVIFSDPSGGRVPAAGASDGSVVIGDVPGGNDSPPPATVTSAVLATLTPSSAAFLAATATAALSPAGVAPTPTPTATSGAAAAAPAAASSTPDDGCAIDGAGRGYILLLPALIVSVVRRRRVGVQVSKGQSP